MTNQRYAATMPDITVATAVANSQTIGYGPFASGMVHVPTGSSITTLTWHASVDDSTYEAAEDSASAAVTQAVAGGQAHPIPAALAGAKYIRATANAAGTIGVTLKD